MIFILRKPVFYTIHSPNLWPIASSATAYMDLGSNGVSYYLPGSSRELIATYGSLWFVLFEHPVSDSRTTWYMGPISINIFVDVVKDAPYLSYWQTI